MSICIHTKRSKQLVQGSWFSWNSQNGNKKEPRVDKIRSKILKSDQRRARLTQNLGRSSQSRIQQAVRIR